ncbi:xaa-Pro aminopeptidase 3 isoform X1 [Tribolium castaneum]|uniref:Putative Xaa-Pro aminopeptidase 3-like Protein n=1 Tax=Tribolium castaneum TaxID=7070 RepID=D6X4Q9_TRICA|nr:PREDICTED: probable Xaa-Pro aminopeptidase 3 isoform X1 [Tribolium castaneum]EEZ97679.2 putative Xaa-Pro aminopeptidase 3-like Protein [Tribolium castaneum]|eukprot:XP_008199099.1 PREDICTED: probable Xaa-Pro aminopeptidase 3 isoform X1 [Tribolium castaneum]
MLSTRARLLLSLLNKSDVFRSYCKKATKGKFEFPKRTIFKSYGQPTHETHPQLLQKDEITPLIKRSEFQDRRQKLMEQVCVYVNERNPSMREHLIVIPSATKQYMSDKIPYFFRQNTDFLYLTGCLEPDSCLILATTGAPSQHCSTLFLREKDDHSELWDGPRTGPDNAPNVFGVDQSLPMSEMENYLQSFFKSNNKFSLWYDFMNPVQIDVHKTMVDYLNYMRQKMWESPKVFIHKQRLIKSPAEVALMQQSCDIASRAIIETIKASHPGINESQIFATVDYECRMQGAEYLAYPPVVAGGNRATTIHYINNNQVVQDGEMVLMDAGCEFHGYSSDITRTWPINGKFSTSQREVYEVVLDVQKKLIQLCENFPTLDSLFDSMCVLLGKGLQEIGLIPKILTNQALTRAAYQFCPHHVSHYLGMDVHDTPLITRNVKIQPGMIVTVEPGVYINHKHQQLPKEFLGMGVRIEDDVLITESGPVILSRNCPKEVSDIEDISSRNV